MLKEIKIEIPNDRGKLEEYEVCERWNDLPTHSYFYDEKCEGCRHIIKMGHGRKKFCGRSYPGTWGSPDIRGQMGCLYCKHYTKKITCQTCQECMYEHADRWEELHQKNPRLAMEYLRIYSTMEIAQKHFNSFKRECNDWLDNIYKDGLKENE